MIELKNHFYLSLRIADKQDFINPQDLMTFLIEEAIGSQLPMFKLEFSVQSNNILKLINEGNTIECQIGRSDEQRQKLVTMTLFVVNTDVGFDKNQIMLSVRGFVGNPLYLSNHDQAGYFNKSSVEVIAAEASRYFKVNNKAQSNDIQTWLRPNITTMLFINRVWEHCSNKISLGISADNTFHIQDLLNLKPNKVWEVTPKTKELSINSDYKYDNQSLFYNQWGGYGRNTQTYNIDTGEYRLDQPKLSKPVYTNKINRSNDRPNLPNSSYMMTKAVNPRMKVNRDELFCNLASLGTSQIEFNMAGTYTKVTLYDKLNIRLPDTEENSDDGRHLSGYWIVTGIKTYIVDRQFMQTFTINREGLNIVKGNLQ